MINLLRGKSDSIQFNQRVKSSYAVKLYGWLEFKSFEAKNSKNLM